jgi:hypothetical protein
MSRRILLKQKGDHYSWTVQDRRSAAPSTGSITWTGIKKPQVLAFLIVAYGVKAADIIEVGDAD